MDSKIITPIGPVCGHIPISGAKNSALLLLAAAVVVKKPIVFNSMPDIVDVRRMCDILSLMNVRIQWVGGDALFVDATDVQYTDLMVEVCGTIRTSVLFLGVMLGLYGKVRLRTPGGCQMGPRPINFHIDAMRQMGADVVQDGVCVSGCLESVQDCDVVFEKPTVTGTVNAILCAVSNPVKTRIKGAAREPEIGDMIQFFQAAGADINCEDGDIVVNGGAVLSGLTYKVMSDRIEAGTFLIAAAILGGKLTLDNVEPLYMHAVLNALRAVGAQLTVGEDTITIEMDNRPKAVDVIAHEYPGFPTDLQPQWCVLAALSDGVSAVVDRVYPSRFDHMQELAKLGVKYTKTSEGVIIEGSPSLTGGRVYARNLRGAAALVLSGLVAQEKTEVLHISELNRGYPEFFLKIYNVKKQSVTE